MANWQQNRAERFSRLVNLHNLPDSLPPDRGVAVNWLDGFTPLLQTGWNPFFENVWYQDHGGIGEWGFRRERQPLSEQLAVKIYVSSLGAKWAREYFQRQAMSSTAPELPYEWNVNGEALTLFVSALAQDGQTRNESLLRLYLNVVFEIRTYDSEFSTIQIADGLLFLCIGHSDDFLPEKQPVLSVPALPETSLSGETIQIGLPSAPDPFGNFRGTKHQIQVHAQNPAAFTGFRGSQALFLLEQPGDGEIRVQAIDRQTLLSREVGLNVQVR